MSNDIHHEETYTHKCGKKYNVRWYYDYDMQSPLEWSDCHGVTERLDWNPTSEEQLEQHIIDNEPELEEETSLRMMRVLARPSNRYDSGLYYDFMATLHKAKDEWGIADHDAAIAAVEKDYAYLKGWYDNDWHWLTVGVAPITIDDDGVETIEEDDREFCGGYESTILDSDDDNRAYRTEVIEDKILEVEWTKRKRIHKDQLELAL